MKNKAAQELGRLGGLVKSEKKTLANQKKGKYGKLGGRPKGSKNKPKEKTN